MLHTQSFIYHRCCIMFFSQYFNSPVSTIPPMLHTHSFIYHQCCIRFFSQYFSFPCQNHTTNVPYSVIHLPPMLYNVFLSVFNSPVSIIPPMLHTHSFIYHPRFIMFFFQYFNFPCTIPPLLHTHLHLHVALTRTNRRCLGTLQEAVLFWKSGIIG